MDTGLTRHAGCPVGAPTAAAARQAGVAGAAAEDERGGVHHARETEEEQEKTEEEQEKWIATLFFRDGVDEQARPWFAFDTHGQPRSRP